METTTPKIENLPVYHIAPSTLNPRKRVDEVALDALADDIRMHGVLQPITVRPAKKGDAYVPAYADRSYLIVMGERRWRAAGIAGLDDIPVIIREDIDDALHLRLAYSENAKREDLTSIECASAYERMLALEPTLTQESLAKRLGVSQARISNRIRLLRLPLRVRDLIEAGVVSESAGLELCAIYDHPGYVETLALLSAEEGGWTQVKFAQEVREFKSQQAAKEEVERVQIALPLEVPTAAPSPEPSPSTSHESPVTESAPGLFGDGGEEGGQSAADTSPVPPPVKVILSTEDVKRADECYCGDKLAYNPKTIVGVKLFAHDGSLYLINSSTGMGGKSLAAYGQKVVSRDEWTGETLDYDGYIRRLHSDESQRHGGGLLVKCKGQQYVCLPGEVQFLSADDSYSAPNTAQSHVQSSTPIAASNPTAPTPIYLIWDRDVDEWRQITISGKNGQLWGKFKDDVARSIAQWTGYEPRFIVNTHLQDLTVQAEEAWQAEQVASSEPESGVTQGDMPESAIAPKSPEGVPAQDDDAEATRILYLLENTERGRWNACNQEGYFVEGGEDREELIADLTIRGHECRVIESTTYNAVASSRYGQRDLEALWKEEQERAKAPALDPAPSPAPKDAGDEWELPRAESEFIWEQALSVPKAVRILRENWGYLLSPAGRDIADAIVATLDTPTTPVQMIEDTLADYAQGLNIDVDAIRARYQ